jgi:succinate dehydrogenase / fumarate reductase cytochrome b subunit
MNDVRKFLHSSLGKKYVMALTGFALVGFAMGHMVGNLQFYLPPEAINRYARLLHASDELLWGVRLVLLACVGLHIWSAVQLSLENKAARPVGYHGSPAPLAASYASRTMLVSGSVILAFVVYHLLHYTLRIETINGSSVPFTSLLAEDGKLDVYAMMVAGFSVWYVSLFYLAGVGLLCLHLSHGIQAMFQSLGWKNHVYGPLLNNAARVIAIVLFLGYSSIPLSVVVCQHGKAHLQEAVKKAAAQAPAGEVKK